MTKPFRWQAQIMIAAFVVMLFACATPPGSRRSSDASRDSSVDTLSARPAMPAEVINFDLEAKAFVPAKARISIYLPPGYDPASSTTYPVLYLNDGQDAAAVGLGTTLARLYAEDAIRKIIVVAIHMLPDRMGTYGLSDRAARRSVSGDSRFGQVGSRAHEYSEWVAGVLVPYVDARYRTRRAAAGRTVLGWSLGGLNAFNLGWEYPDVFAQVGAFSPSFWLVSDRSDAASIQRTRLAQAMVDAGPCRPGSRLWFAAGSAEEADDRDGDGVIDVVDDALDLVRGLERLGYTANVDYASRKSREEQVSFLLLHGGQHNQASWARMLPLFLQWAYRSDTPTDLSTAGK
ncbi:MAG: alpha/beta hydrolase-fold protein [Pseudoxanthomonas sp.]